MTVSLLQLMGFPVRSNGGEPSREKAGSEHAQPDNQGINRVHDGAASSTKGRLAGLGPVAAGAVVARRRDVKVQPKAAAKTKKPAAKAMPVAKAPAKTTVKKAVAKSPPQPAAKAAAKTPVKKSVPVKSARQKVGWSVNSRAMNSTV